MNAEPGSSLSLNVRCDKHQHWPGAESDSWDPAPRTAPQAASGHSQSSTGAVRPFTDSRMSVLGCSALQCAASRKFAPRLLLGESDAVRAHVFIKWSLFVSGHDITSEIYLYCVISLKQFITAIWECWWVVPETRVWMENDEALWHHPWKTAVNIFRHYLKTTYSGTYINFRPCDKLHFFLEISRWKFRCTN